jgi:hypothetical protein
MSDTTWYEIVGRFEPKILPRLVSSDRVLRLSSWRASGIGAGLDWHPTFEGARQELVTRAMRHIADLETQVRNAQQLLLRVQNLTEEQCSKNN